MEDEPSEFSSCHHFNQDTLHSPRVKVNEDASFNQDMCVVLAIERSVQRLYTPEMRTPSESFNQDTIIYAWSIATWRFTWYTNHLR